MVVKRSAYNYRLEECSRICVGLSSYGFSTADICWVIGAVLGLRPSRRKVRQLARLCGDNVIRGRPPISPMVNKRDLYDLIAATSHGIEAFNGNVLHFLHNIEVQFGLKPRQSLNWISEFMRYGRYMG